MSINIANSKTIGFAFDSASGKNSSYLPTSYSTTTLTPSNDAKTLTIETGLYHIIPGMAVSLHDPTTASGTGSHMSGTVTSYNSGTGQLVVNITDSGGIASSSWSVTCGGRVYKLFECPAGEYYFLKNIRIAAEGGAETANKEGYITTSLRIVPSATYGASGSTFATTDSKLGGFYQKTLPFVSGTSSRWAVEHSDIFSKYIVTPGDVIYFELGGAMLDTPTFTTYSSWHVDMIAALEARF